MSPSKKCLHANASDKAQKARQRGVTLIEILVAVVVLSIGLLGLGGMQMNAMKNNLSSLQRNQAIFLSYYILDAMRLNREKALAGDYLIAEGDGCDIPSAPTSGTPLAEIDVHDWIVSLKDHLGESESTCGEISCEDGLCKVKVIWNDARGTDGNEAQFFETTTQL